MPPLIIGVVRCVARCKKNISKTIHKRGRLLNKRNGFCPLFLLFLLLSIACENNTLSEISADSRLSIVLVENNETYFTDSDFEGYMPSSCEMLLNAEGIRKWNSYIPYNSNFSPPIPVPGNHYQKEFVVKIDTTEIYRGVFTSLLSSTIFNSIVITDIIMEKDSSDNRFQIEYYGDNHVTDSRNDERVLEFFRLKEKLIE